MLATSVCAWQYFTTRQIDHWHIDSILNDYGYKHANDLVGRTQAKQKQEHLRNKTISIDLCWVIEKRRRGTNKSHQNKAETHRVRLELAGVLLMMEGSKHGSHPTIRDRGAGTACNISHTNMAREGVQRTKSGLSLPIRCPR